MGPATICTDVLHSPEQAEPFHDPGNYQDTDFKIRTKPKNAVKEQLHEIPGRCVMPLMLIAKTETVYLISRYITQRKGQPLLNPGW